MSHRGEDQPANDGAASVRGDEQSQVQCASKDLPDVNRLDHAAKDRVEKVRQHDHHHNGQDQPIVRDEAQPILQFI